MAEAGTPSISGGVHVPLAHDSARKHVTGKAVYIDDMAEPTGLLHLHLGMSKRAHARVTRLDLDPVRAAPGVVAVFAAGDIPGRNDVSPVAGDDPLFAEDKVQYHGQALFVVAAQSLAAARAAADAAVVDYEDLPAILTIADARAAQSMIEPCQVMRLGDAASALAGARHRLQGRLIVGGQDHFYLEGQIAMALPQEDGDVLVYSSTQHPSEVQHLVAGVLGVPDNAVTVEVRRVGGGFGGKETQPALIAAAAALVAVKTGRPAKLRLDRDDDMILTGKRHDFEIAYDVGFDDQGRIEGIEVTLESRCGYSTDLSRAINDRAMFHVDNAYFLSNATIRSYRYRTNTVSNTAFRGFGGPQGMMAIERVMDHIAGALGRDPWEVRRANLYGGLGRDITPYHMRVEDNLAPQLMAALAQKADYPARRAAIAAFNRQSACLKRGIALTPVKFGISFTTTHLNQAGALIHVYQDGSVHLNHGGTEMGQGLFIKVAQVVAEAFQIDIDRVKITATNTGKVPNTSATAASSGSDINGMAVLAAAQTIKDRLIAFAAERYGVAPDNISFRANQVFIENRVVSFADLARTAYLARVSLSATGFYKTPKIHYDRAAHRGRPFYYFAYGAAVSEVLVDCLTGEYQVTRVDILHDAGRSLNPAIDMGQIEGGFIQGMGWLTTEELVFDDHGRLLTHAPSTYKIPACSDRPAVFNIEIWPDGGNREETVHRSKAVGEPPLMLAISVFSALSHAVAEATGGAAPRLDAPATPERVLAAILDAGVKGAP
ncbi:MAG: xanthine dehydrogenase molybdopterin binding subunit [Pseudomonadota bacterium]